MTKSSVKIAGDSGMVERMAEDAALVDEAASRACHVRIQTPTGNFETQLPPNFPAPWTAF